MINIYYYAFLVEIGICFSFLTLSRDIHKIDILMVSITLFDIFSFSSFDSIFLVSLIINPFSKSKIT